MEELIGGVESLDFRTHTHTHTHTHTKRDKICEKSVIILTVLRDARAVLGGVGSLDFIDIICHGKERLFVVRNP